MTVYLVGAGPGDPDLITVRGQKLISNADAVVFDRLANPKLLSAVRSDAILISAGKGPGSVDLTQEQINNKLVELAEKYECVVRLKGGDPFVFGRGGEEAQRLIDNNIHFEVVPGITSAISAPAYAGIPVTHRGVATNFTVVTGHEDPTKSTEQVKWNDLAKIDGTIVILMGIANRACIAQALIAGGKKPDTPVAIIRNGTRPDQITQRTPLSNLENIEAINPSVIVIGEVADMELKWFENRPLFGKKIVVTRAREQQSEITAKLEGLGATVIEAPAIKIEPQKVSFPDLSEITYVIFTSTNGVHITMDSLFSQGLDVRYFASCSIGAIGQATADALKEYGLVADIVPSRFVAEELVELFPDSSGESVVCFRAADVRDTLENGLAEKGYQVKNIDVYKTRISDVNQETKAALANADVITFASSSTVNNSVNIFGLETIKLIPIKISIGPITSATMQSHGIEVTAQAEPHTIDGIIDTLVVNVNTIL